MQQWRARPRGDEAPALPKWMTAIDRFTAPKAAAFGFGLAGLNPKNLVFVIGAGAGVAQAGLSTGEQAIVLGVFVALGTLGPGLPVAIYFLGGKRATDVLADLREWMSRHHMAIMAVLVLVIGAKLIGDGIAGLSS